MTDANQKQKYWARGRFNEGSEWEKRKKKNIVNLHQTSGCSVTRCFLTPLKRQDFSFRSFRETKVKKGNIYTSLLFCAIHYCFNEIFVLAKVWGSQLMEDCLIHLYSQGDSVEATVLTHQTLPAVSLWHLCYQGLCFKDFYVACNFLWVAVCKMPNVI